jgi:hypothetical protein
VVGATDSGRGGVTGEAEEVIALVEREPKAASDCGNHLLGGLRPTLLLEAGVVVR